MATARCVLAFAFALGFAPFAAAAPKSAGTIEIDGSNAIPVADAAYTGISGKVKEQAAGTGYFVKKHIGNVKYGEATMTIGPNAPKLLYEWIASAWVANYQRRNVRLDTGSSRYEYFNTLVARTTLPALDVKSNAQVGIEVALVPEYAREAALSGASPSAPGLFHAHAFKLDIEGLNTAKVVKIDAFTVKQGVVEQSGDYEIEPGKLEFSNLVVYVAPADVESFKAWHKSFVVDGNNGDSDERTGKLEYQTADKKQTLLVVKFWGLGIFKVAETMAEGEKLFRVAMYVERAELSVPKKGVLVKNLGKVIIGPRKPIPGLPGGLPKGAVPTPTKK